MREEERPVSVVMRESPMLSRVALTWAGDPRMFPE